MALITISPPILGSSLSVNGNTFLAIYGVGFIISLLWACRRRKLGFKKFELESGTQHSIDDPYHLGYLSAGPSRCLQLAIISLIKSGAIAFKKQRWKQNTLVAVGQAKPGFNAIERKLFADILSCGAKGMATKDTFKSVNPLLLGIEPSLASQGLRPTNSERTVLAFSMTIPFIFLGLAGIVRLIQGLSTGYPVGFLIACLIVTGITALLLSASIPRITTAGKAYLAKLREEKGSTFNASPAAAPHQVGLYSFALLGATALQGNEFLSSIDPVLMKEVSNIGATSGSAAGGGCSDGCSSGCGGGGCGGCGGCGG